MAVSSDGVGTRCPPLNLTLTQNALNMSTTKPNANSERAQHVHHPNNATYLPKEVLPPPQTFSTANSPVPYFSFYTSILCGQVHRPVFTFPKITGQPSVHTHTHTHTHTILVLHKLNFWFAFRSKFVGPTSVSGSFTTWQPGKYLNSLAT